MHEYKVVVGEVYFVSAERTFTGSLAELKDESTVLVFHRKAIDAEAAIDAVEAYLMEEDFIFSSMSASRVV